MLRLIAPYLTLMRPKQALKNMFVFAPILFGGKFLEPEALLLTTFVFLLFTLLASAVYVFNDLHDRKADMNHKKKKQRPLASGKISPFNGWCFLAFLLGSFIAIASAQTVLQPEVFVLFGLYAIINTTYTMGLKHVPLVEMFMVASGFVLRVMAGGVAIAVHPSPWMLICTSLLALLIVVGKRRGDLSQNNDPEHRRRVLKAYSLPYLDSLLALISACALSSYLMFCTSPYGLGHYGEPIVITGLFVTLGIFRFLQIVKIENGGDDPSSLMVRDRILIVTMIGWISSFCAIIYL